MKHDIERAIELVIKHGASVSMLQRKMLLNYNKAHDLMQILEHLGAVGKPKGAKPRDVLVNSLNYKNLITQYLPK